MFRLFVFVILALIGRSRDESSPRADKDKKDNPARTSDKTAKLSAAAAWGQVITSVISIIIAGLAYYNTIDFRRRDEIKDELLVTPVVSVMTKDSNSIVLRNSGFGPAIIKQMYIRAQDKKMIIKNKRLYDGDRRKLQDIMKDIQLYTFKPQLLEELSKFHNINYTYNITGEFPFSGEIIQKDSEFNISKINSDEILLNKETTINDRMYYKNAVNSGDPTYNIAVCYCSFTEKSCYFSALRGGITHEKIQQCSEADLPYTDPSQGGE